MIHEVKGKLGPRIFDCFRFFSTRLGGKESYLLPTLPLSELGKNRLGILPAS
jgi:hypothetical protein